jgi:hypothetical protein
LKSKNWNQKIEEVEVWRSRSLKKPKNWRSRRFEVLETQPESATRIESRGLLTWICPSGTHGLVYRAWPIKEVENYKDSKKEGSNPYSTRILVNSCPVAYIKPGRGAPRRIT